MAIPSTGTLASTGVGTGLDVTTLVSKLMAVERKPVSVMNSQTSAYKAQLSAYGSLSSSLASLQSAATALNNLAALDGATATVANATLATASASPGAAPGTYSLVVQTVAQAQSLATPAFASAAATIGTGTLTFDFGTYSGGAFSLNPAKQSATVTIAAGQDSVAGVRDAINAADIGVAASIVNDGTGQRLVITSNDTGTASALRISVADGDGTNTDNAGLSRLAYDASTGGTTNLSEVTAAADATAVVNGISVTSQSNSMANAIEGVTLDLLQAAPVTPTTITVAHDVTSATSAVTAFVTAYNSAVTTLGKLSSYDPATKTGAALQGDSTLIGIQSQMRALLGGAVTGAGGYSTLADLGISFQSDGALALNATTLKAALGDRVKNGAAVLATVGAPSDSLVSYVHATAAATPGQYALVVSQLATQGYAAGSSAAALTVTASVNDTLSLSVDGVDATVTLAAGTYSTSSLAAMLQARINGAAALSDTGHSVKVSSASGVLTLTSDAWGSASKVAITGGNAAVDLFNVPASTDGVDAAGSIGGVAATGSGRTLTAQGLSVDILGGSTGARGTLNFTRGMADSLGEMISGFLSGPLSARTSGIQTSIKAVADQISAFEARMTSTQAALMAQFTALDAAITSMQNTTAFLTQALDSLPKVTAD